MEGLALGALIAIRFRRGPWEISKRRLTLLTFLLLAAAVAGSAWSNPSRLAEELTSPFNRTVGYSLSSIACACLLLWLIHFRGSKLTWLLRISPVQYLGKISYGVYLLHIPVWAAVQFAWKFLGVSAPYDDSLLGFVVVTSLSIACASATWYLMEKPLLNLKDRLAPTVPAKPAVMKAPVAA
jgi:peptidoglycan/LPS O-acetylase OafA/YrhL